MNKKRGFTIVELVIVVAVIGILSAILIPTFSNLTNVAKENALQTNLSSAYSMYSEAAASSESIETVDENSVYLVVESGLVTSADTLVYKRDASDGKWKAVALSARPEGLVKVSGSGAYNGYEVYKVSA